MRFMVMVKANKDSEAGALPDEKLLAEMGNFNEQLVKAGVLLAAEGLHPSSKGARVRFSGAKRTVIDGPFAETKELVQPLPGRVRDRDSPGLRGRGLRRRVHAGAEGAGRTVAR